MAYYRNTSHGAPQVLIQLKQDTSATQSGYKQTRISTSAFEAIDIMSWGEKHANNASTARTAGLREQEGYFGKFDVSGTIEVSDNPLFWQNVCMGCEMYYLSTAGDYWYVGLPVGNEDTANTGTSITAPNGDTLTSSNIVAYNATGGAWDCTQNDTVNSGKCFLPQGPPFFSMKVTIKPYTSNEEIRLFEEVLFMDFEDKSSPSVNTYTIQWRAKRPSVMGRHVA